jgi:hypothetical protein
MIDYSAILLKYYPTAKWSINGGLYSELNWLSDDSKPTQAELDALWPSTQTTITNKQADINRHNAYVTESDPLFFKAQRGEGTMAEWETKVAEIKARYPKV